MEIQDNITSEVARFAGRYLVIVFMVIIAGCSGEDDKGSGYFSRQTATHATALALNSGDSTEKLVPVITNLSTQVSGVIDRSSTAATPAAPAVDGNRGTAPLPDGNSNAAPSPSTTTSITTSAINTNSQAAVPALAVVLTSSTASNKANNCKISTVADVAGSGSIQQFTSSETTTIGSYVNLLNQENLGCVSANPTPSDGATRPPISDAAQILNSLANTFEFSHPGALNDLAELNKIRDNIKAGLEPWKSNFLKMNASELAQRGYVPHAVATVTMGQSGAYEVMDAEAAYTQALLWVLTNEEWHAQKAAEIIDAWSSTLKGHTGLNWYLQSAWTPSILVDAAEILRATYPQWQGAQNLAKLFNDVFLPVLHNRMAFGNREMAVCNAMVAIGVFNDDPAAFSEGIGHWLSYVPTYFYIQDDGPVPKKPDYWITSQSDDTLKQIDLNRLPVEWSSWVDMASAVKNLGDDDTMLTDWTVDQQWKSPGTYIAGYTPETGGRDLSHTEAAFISAVNVAEIAWHQGIDLYSIMAPRLTVFMETMASIRLGEPVSQVAYGGMLNPGNGLQPTYEIAYNHLHNIQGISLPKTNQLILTVIRQMGPTLFDRTFPSQFSPSLRANRIWNQAVWIANWETLTHASLSSP